MDPAAACVAAAHWLAAAAVVAADASGNLPSGVLAEADDIQAASIEVPFLAVQRIVGEGASPRAVVLGLLRVAVAAGDGEIADLAGMVAERSRPTELVQQLPADKREEALAWERVRATLLDPRQAARDLLEHLLDGISSCWLYEEYAGDEDLELDDDDFAADADDNDDIDAADDDDDGLYDPQADAHRLAEVAEEFAELVRDQASAAHSRQM